MKTFDQLEGEAQLLLTRKRQIDRQIRTAKREGQAGEAHVLTAKRKDVEKQIRAVKSAQRVIRNANAPTLKNKQR